MTGKLEVSFNSPQCGWMSIGFSDSDGEFRTTTAHKPYPEALTDFIRAMIRFAEREGQRDDITIPWSRNPEAYDFRFVRDGENLTLAVTEFPTSERNRSEAEVVFKHSGNARQITEAFLETFEQLYEERDVDEFEENWLQSFPAEDYFRFRDLMTVN